MGFELLCDVCRKCGTNVQWLGQVSKKHRVVHFCCGACASTYKMQYPVFHYFKLLQFVESQLHCDGNTGVTTRVSNIGCLRDSRIVDALYLNWAKKMSKKRLIVLLRDFNISNLQTIELLESFAEFMKQNKNDVIVDEV